jgi:hypothetical protein
LFQAQPYAASKGLLLFLGCLLFDYFSPVIGSAEMADLVGRLEVVALRTRDKGWDEHTEVAASFALSRLSIFSFW